ncbi:DUF6510 family protein [Streptomyces sp. NPDC060275]|uniref:DUF6510 family protein n=1 Tax=Streptomyces sp. NPDC060275 TaxID=3347090 RepID=UPI00365C02A0
MTPTRTDEPDADGVPDGHVDGNALAGPLSEVFAVDVTAATSRCAHCGCTGPLARLYVYDKAPGLVARCQQCGGVVLRMVRARGAACLDMTGVGLLSIPLGEAGVQGA